MVETPTPIPITEILSWLIHEPVAYYPHVDFLFHSTIFDLVIR
jgi:hypothetical protein